VTIFIYGDQTEAAKYRSTVEHYLNELQRTFGETSRNQSYWRQLSGTAKVHLRLINGQPFAYLYVEGNYIYMDSGIMEFDGYSHLNLVETYRPGIFHHTLESLADSKSSYPLNGLIGNDKKIIAGKTPAYLGRNMLETALINEQGLISSGLIEAERSCSLGNKYVSRTDVSLDMGVIEGHPEIETHFIGTEHEFNKDSYAVKRLIMELFPASVLTGKAKLFVQSLYGSDRNDFNFHMTYVEGNLQAPDGFYLPVYTDSVWETLPTITPYSKGYNVVFVPFQESLKILLIETSRSSFKVYDMEPSNKIGRDCLKQLINIVDTDLKLKMEAVVLASCVVASVVQDLTDIIGVSWLIGDFAAYDWKFNSAGDKGVGVLCRKTGESAPFETTFTKMALTVNCSITQEDESIPPAYRIELAASIASSGSISSYVSPIWVPGLFTYDWLGDFTGVDGVLYDDAFTSFGEAIVYAYFDANDAVVDVTVSQTVNNTPDPTRYETTDKYFTLSGAISGIAYTYSEKIYDGQHNNHVNITVGEDTVHTVISTNSGLITESTSVYTGTGEAPVIDPAHNRPASEEQCGIAGLTRDFNGTPIDEDGNTYYLYGGWIYWENMTTVAHVKDVKIGSVAVCIPKDDASSVIIYNSEHQAGGYETYTTSASVGGVPQNGDACTGLFKGIFHPELTVGPVDFPWTCRTPLNLGLEITQAPPNYYPPDISEANTFLFGANIGSSDNNIESLPGDPLFNTTFFHPWYKDADLANVPTPRVKQSMQNAWRVNYFMGIGLKNKDYEYNSAVGWA
jgi:hypothetical protein